jgi:PAS domain S-box-containing protein
MSTISIPMVVIASISIYVGLYHLGLYLRRRQHRVDLAFALTCFVNGVYDIFCGGLYNATSVANGVQWQRLQFITLALLNITFLWFILVYTHQKPQMTAYAITAFLTIAMFVQAIDRSELTWVVNPPAIKEMSLPFGLKVIYYEATLGIFTTIMGLMGLVVATYILWIGIRYYRQGHKRESTPLLIALCFMYLTALNDTAISDGLYQFVYTIEYGYIAMILLMANSLSNIIIEATGTKESLIESEERFRTIVENSHAGIITINNNFQISYVNDQLCKIAGYIRDEMIGKDFRLFLDDKSRQGVADMYIRRQRGQSVPPRYELTIIRKNGINRIMEMSAATTALSTGEVRTIGQLLDVTERKQAEEALKQANLVVENSPAVLFRWGVSEGWPVEMVSKNVTQFGYTPEELLSRAIPFASLVHPQDLERVGREVKEYTNSGVDHFNQEYRIVTPQGEVRWVDDRTAIERNADGKVTNYQGIVFDITERKQLAHENEERRKYLESIFASVPDAIITSNTEHHISEWNPGAERLFGFTKEEAVGRVIDELITGTDPYAKSEAVGWTQHIQKSVSIPPTETIRYRKDGSPVDVVVSVSPIQIGEEWHGVVAVYTDITERKRAEAALRRDIDERKRVEVERENLIKELETRNAELERFTYIVSHDLRSPLVTIRGFLGYLEKNVSLGNTDQVKADISRIATATNKMQRMLTELLDLSRIGRMMNPSEKIDFSELVQEAIELVRMHIEARGIQLNVAANLPSVYGDRARILEVIQNLMDNACKFMGDQPDPIIDIGIHEITMSREITFFVRDNGIGIDPQFHERIFGIFNKLDIHTDGTGVGLALAKRIVEEHGGRIWVESQGKGTGSTFYFTLPAPPNEANKN